MKIASIVGARPQFVKLAVTSQALRARGCQELLVHTGQHYDDCMSAVFFEQLGLPPVDVNLGIGSGSHGWQTGRMLEQLEAVLIEARPDWVLLFGDTNSTLSGALAAAKLKLPIAHVEAGLRARLPHMPEEINRILTDRLSDRLYAPSASAVDNLAAEGISGAKVQLVGDVMYDAVRLYGAKAEAESSILEQLGLTASNYLLATVHRPVNTDHADNLRTVLDALAIVAAELPVVLPLHPRTRAAIARAELSPSPRIHLIDPLSYLDMLQLERHACLIATDSGGVQKEAYFAGVPCVTLRAQTEWVELVQSGWNELCAPDQVDAPTLAQRLMSATAATLPATRPDLYGRGNAAQKIAADLMA